MRNAQAFALACIAAAGCYAAQVRADVVTDWNTVAGDLIAQARIGTPPATRMMAIVQTAVHEAVLEAPQGAGTEAAVAAASRATLLKLVPQQEAAVTAAYRAALGRLGDSPAAALGIAAGERAAARVLAWRAEDGAAAPDRYRPHAAA